MLGFALVLLGSAVAFTARLPKVLGFLMGLSGLTYFLQGWVLGFEGFSETNTVAILAGYCLSLAWTVWLAVIAWRQNERPSEPNILRHPAQGAVCRDPAGLAIRCQGAGQFLQSCNSVIRL